jgi:hypothetical protein
MGQLPLVIVGHRALVKIVLNLLNGGQKNILKFVA